MNIKKTHFIYILYLIYSIGTSINAKLEFINRDSSITLKPTNSRLKFSSINNVMGWKEESIILETGNDNSWLSPNIIYGDIVTDTNAPTHLLYNDSNAIVNLEDTIIENSNAIVNISDDVSENSNAIVNLQKDIAENSSALITCCNNANDLIQQNSMAIVTNDNDINYNSQAIVTINNDMDLVKLIAQNSAAIIGNSNTLVTLDREVIENSNAIVNNSWAIADLNNQIHENSWAIQNLIEHGEAIELVAQNSNAIFSASQSIITLDREIIENSNAIVQASNAIVTLNNYIEQNSNFIEDNSWAILNLQNDIIENSYAIVNNDEEIAHNSAALITCCNNANDLIQQNSQTIVTNNNDINYNSQAIVSLDNQVGVLITENSNAIVNINEDVIENSMAIALNRSILDLHDNSIEQNSEAIISNAINLSDLQEDVIENSNAIVNIESDLAIENSNAIINSEKDITENSNAIVNIEDELAVQNSNAIINLKEDIAENSQAIVNNYGDIINNSNAITTINDFVLYISNSVVTINEEGTELAEQNSSALITCCNNANNSITENSNAIVNLQEDINENSNAIIFITEVSTNLAVENSNAIVNNSSFIAQELIIENSNAIVSIDTNTLPSGIITNNILLDNSGFLNPSQQMIIDGNITFDGQGAIIYFATHKRPTGPQFIIKEGKTVILKNINLTGLTSNTFDFRKNSTVIIGENVTWELDENITLTTGNIIIQNQTSGGLDIANLFHVRGKGGKKRLTLSPSKDTTLPMINLGQNTLSLQNIEFTGLEYVSKSLSSDGFLIGAIGLAGEADVNIETSNNMAFAIMGLANTFRILEHNLHFNGQLDFVGLGEDVVHFDFVLRSPIESLNAATQLINGKVPVVNFATNFIYLTSLSGIARIIFDDAIIRVNNASDAFIVTNNGYLAANKLLVSGDPIWDASSNIAKNRFAVEAQEIVAVTVTGDDYILELPEFGIPIIVDPYHPHRTADIRSIQTGEELLENLTKYLRPQSALQIEMAK